MPLCNACGADEPVTHTCPDCGATQAGSGRSCCMPCALARRIASRAAILAGTFRQIWVRQQFLLFCNSLDTASVPGDMARRLVKHAEFFAVFDDRLTGPEEITQQRLLDEFGAEGMRRAVLPVRFVASELKLDWNINAGVDHSDQKRTIATLAASSDEPWSGDLEAYREHLAAGRHISHLTIRMYVASAAALLRTARAPSALQLSQADVSRYLHRYRGRRTNIMPFLSWTSSLCEVSLDVGPARGLLPRKREKAILKKAGDLLTRLRVTRSQPERRALLAAAISVVHGVPLRKVLTLRRVQVETVSPRAVFWKDGNSIELAAPLSAAFRASDASEKDLRFPGRNSLQPLSTAAVRHHVRAGRSLGQSPSRPDLTKSNASADPIADARQLRHGFVSRQASRNRIGPE